MPTDVSAVGPLPIPWAEASADINFSDRTLVGLLDYLGHWLRVSLVGTTDPVVDACPATNLFPWDHKGTFVRDDDRRLPIPGLWAWELSIEPTDEYATILYEVVRREIRVQYIYKQVRAPIGERGPKEVVQAAGRIFAKATERGRRSDYGFDGAPAGTLIAESCGWRHWKFKGGRIEPVRMMPAGGQAQTFERKLGDEGVFYLAFTATFHIWERIQLQAASVDDVAGPSEFLISHGDDSNPEALPLMDRVVPDDD